jgi:hypothetical protein
LLKIWYTGGNVDCAVMSHSELSEEKDKSFSSAVCEMEEKKSEIFFLPFHKQQMKKYFDDHNHRSRIMLC